MKRTIEVAKAEKDMERKVKKITSKVKREMEIQRHRERVSQRTKDVATITPGVQPVAYHPTNRDNFQEVSTIILRIVECWPVDLQQKFHRMYGKQRYHR